MDQAQPKNEGKGLPPIASVVEPAMEFTSTRIRWYRAIGYSFSDIAKRVGVKYQQVRNVCMTDPKRGAREPLPPFPGQQS